MFKGTPKEALKSGYCEFKISLRCKTSLSGTVFNIFLAAMSDKRRFMIKMCCQMVDFFIVSKAKTCSMVIYREAWLSFDFHPSFSAQPYETLCQHMENFQQIKACWWKAAVEDWLTSRLEMTGKQINATKTTVSCRACKRWWFETKGIKVIQVFVVGVHIWCFMLAAPYQDLHDLTGYCGSFEWGGHMRYLVTALTSRHFSLCCFFGLAANLMSLKS